ncbi:MAG: RNA polymerase sigma factor [Candidatus Riflebacteria bacterium]|nr:RNA polymerase sigma factor [Candidatus Riflebacteria bacterium]
MNQGIDREMASGTSIPDTDADLVLLVRQGRREAFQPLVEKYWSRVKALIRRVIRIEESCEDLCQETFLRAFDRLDSYDISRPFSPWLLKIAWNITGEALRKQGRQAECVPLEDELLPSKIVATIDQVIGRMVVDECLELLPLGYRILFVLRHGLQLNYEDIAQIVGEPVGTVKTHLYRARERLREHLTDPIENNHKQGENVSELPQEFAVIQNEVALTDSVELSTRKKGKKFS